MKAFCEAYDFKNLQFEDVERDSVPATDSEEAFVSISLERKLRSSLKFDFIVEKTRFRRNPDDGVWNMVSAEVKIDAANKRMVKDTQEKQFKK